MNRAAVLLSLLPVLAACNRPEQQPPTLATATPATAAAPHLIGNPVRGKALAAQYGCNVCHIIPGVEGPQGSLGPSLQGLVSRPLIGYDTVKNTPQNVSQYIQNPASLNPQTSMPALGLTPADANDIAAYLTTLK